MPTLDESMAGIVDALDEHYGRPVAVGVAAGLDPFAALIAVLLARATDPPRVTKALDALTEAGLLEPHALAEADLAEIDDLLKSSGVTLPARGLAPIPRL